MAPARQSAGSVPRDINSVDRRTSQTSHDIPRSLPRFEGFASTLGGFARSPQVSRTPSRFLPRNDEPRRPSPNEAHSSSAFVRSLQTPLLHHDASEASSSNQQQPPQSLLARSLGSLTDVFSRQVTLQLGQFISHPPTSASHRAESSARRRGRSSGSLGFPA